MNLWTLSLIIGYGLTIILNVLFVFSITTFIDLLMSLVIIMTPGSIFLFAGRKMPKNFFSENRPMFKIGNTKQWICNATNVKAWKDKIPVGGRVAGFRLNKISNPHDIEYLNRFIFESCFAEWLHSSLCVWSVIAVLIISLMKPSVVLPMALPIAIVFIYQNMTSTIIQWYTRPRMIRYRDLMLMRAGRNQVQTELPDDQTVAQNTNS